jgi:long-chain fatty acid transport protein
VRSCRLNRRPRPVTPVICSRYAMLWPPTPRGAPPSSPSRGRRTAWIVLALSCLVVRAAIPQTADQLLKQDEIDLAGRTSLTLGSGARAFGMGGAFLARADDATAAAWNPAGLSYLRLPEVSLAGNHTTYNRDSGVLDQDHFAGSAADFAALTWPVRLHGLSGAVQVSFQRAVPFGGARTVVRPRGEEREPVVSTGEASGGFDVLALGTGWRLTRTLRSGLTINRWFNGYTQTLNREVPDSIRRNRIFDTEFGFGGWNFNLGLIWTPLEQLNLAAVYKTPFTADVHLDKTRTDFFFAGNESTTNAYVSDAVRLKFPAALGFGMSWRPRSALTLSADLTRTYWSRSQIQNYFTLPVTPRPVPVPVPAPPPFIYDPLPYYRLDEPQVDTDQIRLGAEYVLVGSRVKVPLRAGYFNDEQIIVRGGGAPRFNGFTAGIGIIVGPVLLDVAYLWESGWFTETRDLGTDPPTTAQVRTSLRTERFFASIIYRIGGSN